MTTSRHRVLITGVNGYIGSHLAKVLSLDPALEVSGLDVNLSVNHPEKYLHEMYYESILNQASLKKLRYQFDTVIHLAGLISVEESVTQPCIYSMTNVEGTINAIECLAPQNFIFASTATAFNPANPYALTKALAEYIIRQKCKNYTIFRFFNVAGSDGEFRQIGKSTHLIRVAAECAAGKRPKMAIYGSNWPTKDGTCERDYIHVLDLVDAISKAVYNPRNTKFECLGTGTTHSCLEVIETMKRVTGKDFPVLDHERRDGDVSVLSIPEGMISKFIDCKYTLEDMCRSAYEAELTR